MAFVEALGGTARRSAGSISRPSRVLALDVARALGVIAMVFGHTCDALLSTMARTEPAIIAYWKARGLTAPLFLMVSGWAVTLALSRRTARGPAMIRERLPRVLLLLAFGYLLRFPGWDLEGLLAGNRTVWQHLLAFDVLHTIAVGLLIATIVLALPWRRREKALTFILLAVLTVTLGMSAPSPIPNGLPALALQQAMGGTSPFPLFPWLAYFCSGAAIPLLANDSPIRRATVLASLGAALVAATCWQGVGIMPPGHPTLILFRIGVILMLLAALEACPRRLAAVAAPLGRSSLGVYMLHVPVVYGWSTLEGLAQRIGPQLQFYETALIALGVLACAFVVERGVRMTVGGATAAILGYLRSDASRQVSDSGVR